MTRTLGEEIKSRRKALRLTQQAVALELGVTRATVAQWESGTHSPSAERLGLLDEVLGARGVVVDLGGDRQGDLDGSATQRNLRLSEVLQNVADALVDALITEKDGGRPLGWAHDLGGDRRQPTPLSTAYVIRTLQRLDDSRVDLHALADVLLDRREDDEDAGWTNRTSVGSRPEVTAVVLGCLARLGQLPDVEAEIRRLVDGLDDFDRSRPYILCSVLDALLIGHPDPDVVEPVVQALLAVRTRVRPSGLWVQDASVPAHRVDASLAHTARAATLLHVARRIVGPTLRGQVDEAVGTAVAWIIGRTEPDWGATEILNLDVDGRPVNVAINHFTAAWCVRLLSAVDGVPRGRIDSALRIVWGEYRSVDRLWGWGSAGSLPSWMTHDAVAALRTYALTSVSSPLTIPDSAEDDNDNSNSAV